MQVRIDVKFMHTNFDGCGLFGFGDMATFQKQLFISQTNAGIIAINFAF